MAESGRHRETARGRARRQARRRNLRFLRAIAQFRARSRRFIAPALRSLVTVRFGLSGSGWRCPHAAIIAIIAKGVQNRLAKPMNRILKGIGLSAALAITASIWLAMPASAISVELAKKCRDMAIKAHPPTLPGAKKGSAQAERAFYRSCIANGGNMPEEGTKKDAAPPPK